MKKYIYYFIIQILILFSGLANTAIFAEERYDVTGVKIALIESLNEVNAKIGSQIYLRIFKLEAELELWVRNNDGEMGLFRTYPICNYSGELGPKLKEGDYQSPEGFYSVGKSQLNPNSSYHLSFNLGFPNRYDKSHKRTGSYLMVHGNCVSIGCYAMTDEKIEEIYTMVSASQIGGQTKVPVHAFPFRMTTENMETQTNSQWYKFWQNLKQGYDHFESTKEIPDISVVDGVYIVNNKN